jgi:hypothetical protein
MPIRYYHLAMTEKTYPSDAQERFMVRMPDGMRDEIARAAKANGRSMNAEVVARLAGAESSMPSASKALDTIVLLHQMLAKAELQARHAYVQLALLGTHFSSCLSKLSVLSTKPSPSLDQDIKEWKTAVQAALAEARPHIETNELMGAMKNFQEATAMARDMVPQAFLPQSADQGVETKSPKTANPNAFLSAEEMLHMDKQRAKTQTKLEPSPAPPVQRKLPFRKPKTTAPKR